MRWPNTGSLPPTETLADVFGAPLRRLTDHALRKELVSAVKSCGE